MGMHGPKFTSALLKLQAHPATPALSSCLVKTGGMHRPHGGLSWIARFKRLGGFTRTVTIRDTVLGRLAPPGHCTNSRLTHTSSLPVKKAFHLPWNSRLRGRLQVCHTSRGYGASPMEQSLRATISAHFRPCYRLRVPLRRSFHK